MFNFLQFFVALCKTASLSHHIIYGDHSVINLKPVTFKAVIPKLFLSTFQFDVSWCFRSTNAQKNLELTNLRHRARIFNANLWKML